MDKHPYNCVGFIISEYKDKITVGTGFLVASNVILTAAHNICQVNSDNDLVFAYKAYYQMPINSMGHSIKIKLTTALSYSSKYLDLRLKNTPEKAQEDWALFFLETSVRLNKYFQLEDNVTLEEFNNKNVRTLGFKKKGNESVNLRVTENNVNMFQLFEDAGECTVVKGNSDDKFELSYNMNLKKGMSGGPIFYERDNGDCVIVGVHHGIIKGRSIGCFMNNEKRNRIQKSSQ